MMEALITGSAGTRDELATRDPLAYLDREYPASGDAIWLPSRQLVIADPAVARGILANADGLYVEHSDFFHVRDRIFGPRAAQVAIGSGARSLLTSYLAARAHLLEGRVHAMLSRAGRWPDAGNRLIQEHLADAILSPESPAPLREVVEDVVTGAVLAGAREERSRWRRAALRFRVAWALARAVEARRARPHTPPRDLLDVVVAASGDAPEADVGEVFLSCLFAVVGSVGFTLAWSMYLVGTHPSVEAPPAWIVREALRLWPIAWFLARRPARPHEVLGHQVTPADEVVVCPYLIHRNPRHWESPLRYRPERWAEAVGHRAFMPFGWGPHACAAASLSLSLVEDVLRVALARWEIHAIVPSRRPQVAAALAPPRFTVHASRREGGRELRARPAR